MIVLYSYLPRAPYSFKELRHPHGQNHGFLQKPLGLLQVSNVTPILKYVDKALIVLRFYIHVGNTNDALGLAFPDLINCFGVKQNVTLLFVTLIVSIIR